MALVIGYKDPGQNVRCYFALLDAGKDSIIYPVICYSQTVEDHIRDNSDVRLSLGLLTMINPNQLCDVLLFVCSKMANETNLSFKLPVADKTKEV